MFDNWDARASPMLCIKSPLTSRMACEVVLGQNLHHFDQKQSQIHGVLL